LQRSYGVLPYELTRRAFFIVSSQQVGRNAVLQPRAPAEAREQLGVHALLAVGGWIIFRSSPTRKIVRERAIELAVINRRLAHDTTNSD
jgi:hypothetical protein